MTLALCVIAVLVSVSYVDRPLAEFFNAHIRHTELWGWLDRLLAPFVVIPVVGLVFLLGLGCWRLSGRQLRAWAVKPLLLSWSAMWAVAAEFMAVLLCTGVGVTNGHWLSDVIAGAFLGASIGRMTVLLPGSQVLRAVSESAKHDRP